METDRRIALGLDDTMGTDEDEWPTRKRLLWYELLKAWLKLEDAEDDH